jgi:hypothetical protein
MLLPLKAPKIICTKAAPLWHIKMLWNWHLAVFFFVSFRLNFRKIIEDVKGPDVQLVYRKDEWIASDDERKRPDFGYPVSDPDWKLSMEVLSALLEQ